MYDKHRINLYIDPTHLQSKSFPQIISYPNFVLIRIVFKYVQYVCICTHICNAYTTKSFWKNFCLKIKINHHLIYKFDFLFNIHEQNLEHFTHTHTQTQETKILLKIKCNRKNIPNWGSVKYHTPLSPLSLQKIKSRYLYVCLCVNVHENNIFQHFRF